MIRHAGKDHVAMDLPHYNAICGTTEVAGKRITNWVPVGSQRVLESRHPACVVFSLVILTRVGLHLRTDMGPVSATLPLRVLLLRKS